MSGIIRPFRDAGPRIAADAWIAETAMLVGAVEVKSRANIWFGAVLRGDIAPIFVGANTNVQDGTVVHVSRRLPEGTRIGANVTIGHMCLIHACTLEDGCFIGMKALCHGRCGGRDRRLGRGRGRRHAREARQIR